MRTPWFRGPLLSRHFAEQMLPDAFGDRLGGSSSATVHRSLRRWLNATHAALGPASGLRAICDVGAVPFFACLGYRVRSVSGTGDPSVIVATLEGAQAVRLPLVVLPWNANLDQAWSTAIRVCHGRELHATAPGPPRENWAVGFTASRIRLLDVDRPYARRFLEFDLAETIDDESRCRLLWSMMRPAAFAMTSPHRVSAHRVSAHHVPHNRVWPHGVSSHRVSSHRVSLVAEVVAACDAHGVGVREALQGGVREALALLCAELARTARRARPPVRPADIVAQGLTLLYRVLFLLFAEARALVPVWHPIYRDSYTIATLQREAERPSPRGLWEALQAISRLAHAGCEMDDLSVTAFNGQLFSPTCTPLVDRARIDSATIARVLHALMTAPARTGRGRERITYADLGVEQLGAVYERILDYAPQLEAAAGRKAAREVSKDTSTTRSTRSKDTGAAVSMRTSAGRTHLRRTSVRRKESGTFYTPRGLADFLVRETLGPLTATASSDRILRLRVLDPAMGSGAFLVSACRFLAHAYEQALVREDRPLPATDDERADIRRTIARQCLFGVDANPMAVQLARLSLWLTTLTSHAPLTFLDHHLRAGDSLAGASLDDLARRLPARPRPLAMANAGAGAGATGASADTTGHASTRRGRAIGTSRRRPNVVPALPLFPPDDTSRLMRAILPRRAQLTVNDDCPETVHGKERLLASLARETALADWRALADIWCATWFWQTDLEPPAPPQTAWTAICDAVLHGRSALPPRFVDAWRAHAATIAARRRFFHWTLEFPEVFFEESGEPRPDGGFDAILGNPPWDMVRDDVRADAAACDAAEIAPQADDTLRADRAPRTDGTLRADGPARADGPPGDGARGSAAALARFVRETGIYAAVGDAHTNSYQLFVDRALSLLRPGGRLGLVVPWGLAADHGSARLRRRLLERCDVDAMIAFDNRDRLFPIHRSLRFLLFTCTSGRPTTSIACRFGERDPAVLDRIREARDASTGSSLTVSSSTWAASAHAAASVASAAPPSTESLVAAAGSRSAAPRAAVAGATPGDAPQPRAIAIAPGLLRRLSGESLAFPDLRTPADLALVERLHASWPALTSRDGWAALFSRELNITDDRAWFVPPGHGTGDGWPVIEGKHVHPFAVRASEARFLVPPDHFSRVRRRVPGLARDRLAYRDVSSPTNRLTLIAAIVPRFVVTTHTLFCSRSPVDMDAQHALCALMNSFVANYLIRLRVSTHVTLALLDRLPMPAPRPGEPIAESDTFGPLAALATRASQGVAAPDVHAEVQARAAHAYGLTPDELRHVLSTFPLIDRKEKDAAFEAFLRL